MTKGAVGLFVSERRAEILLYGAIWTVRHTEIEGSGGRDGALEGEGCLGLGGAELLGGGLGRLDWMGEEG